jgi:hypothetical protein
MIRFLILLVVLYPGVMTDRAVAAKGQFYIIGQGNLSCGTWTTARRSRVALGHEQWVVGFLSGAGDVGASSGSSLNPLNGMDYEGVLAWIDNYCLGQPIATIAKAAEAFLNAHPR